jgi:hypothetical protein
LLVQVEGERLARNVQRDRPEQYQAFGLAIVLIQQAGQSWRQTQQTLWFVGAGMAIGNLAERGVQNPSPQIQDIRPNLLETELLIFGCDRISFRKGVWLCYVITSAF